MYEPTQIEVKRKMIDHDAHNDVPKSLGASLRGKICSVINFDLAKMFAGKLSLVVRR